MFNLGYARWLRVLGGAALILVIGFMIATFIVTAYASSLAMQARGAPDQNAINQFANATIPALAPGLAFVSALGGAWFVTRKLGRAAFTNALLMGALAAVGNAFISILSGFTFGAVVEFVAFLLGSALAGWLAGRGNVEQSTV